MCCRSPAVRCTPFVMASSATIRPTPIPTPTAVSTVLAGRRKRFFQISDAQVTAELGSCLAAVLRQRQLDLPLVARDRLDADLERIAEPVRLAGRAPRERGAELVQLEELGSEPARRQGA